MLKNKKFVKDVNKNISFLLQYVKKNFILFWGTQER